MVPTSRIGIGLATALLALAMTGEAKAQGYGRHGYGYGSPYSGYGGGAGYGYGGYGGYGYNRGYYGAPMYYVPQTYNNLNGLAGMIGRTVAPRSTSAYGTPMYRRRR